MRHSFLQSFEWGEFQKSLGRSIWRVENSGLKALIIKYDLPWGKSYLYCPRGPLIEKREFTPEFIKRVKEIAHQEGSIFLRCDPSKDLGLKEFGFQLAPKNYYFSAVAAPLTTALLNTALAEKELWAKMNPKTRYNIRLARKKDVLIKESRASQDLDVFYRLLAKTAQKENFKLHLREHYQKLMDVFKDEISLFLAYYQGRPIAGIMVLFYNQTAIYLHGGSDYEYRRLMAPHLLQWQAILEAKKRGCKQYDFGGIDEKSSWAGLTRFKLSFGARAVRYPGAYDLVFRPIWYRVYNFIRKIKRYFFAI